ncbi:hypothetical protein E2542_SST03695 [Spatholobus suberectus]|nr:hypothetical protein E2542_SST03695 [Spatholobus suberectus]
MSEDGDIIDCVNVYKQPAFDHPALKNHTIKMMPHFLRESQNSSTKEASQSESVTFRTWQKSGSCPNGTVPIRRILKEDLLRVASVDRFGQKPPAVFKNTTNGFNLNFINPNDSKASYLVTMGYNYIGAQADINIWNPKVDLPDDFTTAQIWLKNGNGADFESVEAGWTVNPKLYGDRKTRLFAYGTRDSYKSIGCFDLTCPGFVQTGTEAALGGIITPVSSQYGEQYQLNVGMFWSQIKKQTPHTGTGMGSGDFANGLRGNACYMSNVRIKDYSLQLKYPEFVSAAADEPYCYNSLNYIKGYGVEPVLYFGGPGRRPPYCP